MQQHEITAALTTTVYAKSISASDFRKRLCEMFVKCSANGARYGKVADLQTVSVRIDGGLCMMTVGLASRDASHEVELVNEVIELRTLIANFLVALCPPGSIGGPANETAQEAMASARKRAIEYVGKVNRGQPVTDPDPYPATNRRDLLAMLAATEAQARSADEEAAAFYSVVSLVSAMMDIGSSPDLIRQELSAVLRHSTGEAFKRVVDDVADEIADTVSDEFSNGDNIDDIVSFIREVPSHD